MYNLDQIIEFVNSIVDLSKDTESKIVREMIRYKRGNNPRKEDCIPQYPEYFSFYRQACMMRDQIKYHAEKSDDFPEMLFRVKAPRMAAEEYDYVKGNFKQVTLPVYLDFESTISRGFNDTSWSVSFPPESEENKREAGSAESFSYRKYVEEKVPEYGSYENFMKFFLPHLKLTDPCGCIVIRPQEFKFRPANEDEIAAGADPATEYLDNSVRPEPMPIYFRIDQLKGYKPGQYFLFESDQRSVVEYANKKKERVGRIFEFYDKNQIVFITQIGKYSDYKFSAKVMLEHKWNKFPVKFNGGVPKITKDGIMQISPFSYAVDLLDLVLINESNLQASINSCVYPYRIVEGNDCDFEYEDREGNKIVCDDGWINDILLDAKFKCPNCSGSGLKSNMGPMGVMVIKQMTSLDQQTGTQRLRDPMMFVSPPVEPLEFLRKKKADDEMKARKILHLQDSNSNVQPTQDQNAPALKTALDLKGLYAFLKTILDQVFDHLVFYYESTAMYLYGSEQSKYEKYLPSVAYPVSYDFKTESDYLSEIAAATQSNLPPFVIHTIIYRYISALYFNDKKTASVFLLLVACDRLLIFSSQAIESKQGKGLVEDWEIILHDSGLSLIDQLAEMIPDFFDDIKTPFDKRKKLLIAKAKSLDAIIKMEIQAARQAQLQMESDSIMNSTGDGSSKTDMIGKIPLALQQLALSKERAMNAGDTEQAKLIGDKMNELLTKISVSDPAVA